VDEGEPALERGGAAGWLGCGRGVWAGHSRMTYPIPRAV
jgi:uncharacterized protein YfaQ (DUF2300 family)